MRPRTSPGTGVLLALSAAGVLHLLSRSVGAAWVALLSAALIGLVPAAVATRPRLTGLRVARTVQGAPVAGSPTATELGVHNAGPHPSPALVLSDALPGHAPVRVAVPALAPGDRLRVPLQRPALRRTAGPAGEVELVARSPFGLLRTRGVLVLPGEVRVRPAQLAPARHVRGGAGEDGPSRPLPGTGTELLGLRDWRPGDAARSVAARATARHGRPVVLERERDGGDRLVVLVRRGEGEPFARARSQAAGLLVAAVRSGAVPELHGLPSAPPAPGPGASALLDALAGADDALLSTGSPPAAVQAAVLAAARAAGRGGLVAVTAPVPALRGVGARLQVLGG